MAGPSRGPDYEPDSRGVPRWVKVSGLIVALLVVLVVVMMLLFGGGQGGHGPSRHVGVIQVHAPPGQVPVP